MIFVLLSAAGSDEYLIVFEREQREGTHCWDVSSMIANDDQTNDDDDDDDVIVVVGTKAKLREQY